MSHDSNLSLPNLSFAETEHYGSGVSVKPIDFEAKGTTPPFKATYFQILPGYTTQVDQHKVEECWLVLQGKGVLNYEEQSIHLQEQDMVHFAPYKGHQVTNNGEVPLLMCSIYW